MNQLCRAFVLALLLLAGGASAADGAPGGQRPPSGSRRRIVYFANYEHDATLPVRLAMLVDACDKGYLTHVVIGLFHLDWLDWERKKGESISLNGVSLRDPRLQPLWEAVGVLRAKGVKVLASFGGADVKDYRQLLHPDQPRWYPQLREMLRGHAFDGLDLDIEEPNDGATERDRVMDTAHVRRLVKRLRADLGEDFLVTSAPVAVALTTRGSRPITPDIDFALLLREGAFDWYHLQFYNSFGDLLAGPFADSEYPDYEEVLRANPGVPASRFVAGVPTSPETGDGYRSVEALCPTLSRLSGDVARFGGVYGWTFQRGIAAHRLDPVGWTRGIAGAVRGGECLPPVATPRRVASATPRYTYHDLGSDAFPTAVNTRGGVVGWNPVRKWPVASWDGGAMQRVREVGGQATGIDEGGSYVGWLVANGSRRAFLAPASCTGGPDACWRDLGTLGGGQSEAWAMNAAQAAGWSELEDRTPRAFVCDLSGGAMRDLGTFGGRASQATAIDAEGTVGGWAQANRGTWLAFRWRPGEPMELAFPAAASLVTGLSVDGARRSWTVGWTLGREGFEAWLSVDGTATRFGARLGPQSAATAVNARGRVVGWYLDDDGVARAFVYDAADASAAPEDLEDLVEGVPAGDGLVIATALDDRGEIVGQTRNGRAFLLVPRGAAVP